MLLVYGDINSVIINNNIKNAVDNFLFFILNIIYIINPDCIIIGPDYPDTEDFINKIRSAVRNFVPEFVERNATIRYSKINEDSFMLGGYYYTLETLCKRGNIFELIRTAKALP